MLSTVTRRFASFEYRGGMGTNYPKPSIRAKQKEATREALIDAAVSAFGRGSYASTRIDDIAAEAGAGRATFYLHFRSKASLLEALTARARAKFEPLYEELVPLLRDGSAAGIQRWIVEALSEWSETAEFMRPVYEATDGNPELAGKLLPEPLPGASQLASTLLRANIGEDDEDATLIALVFLAPLYVVFRSRETASPVAEQRLAEITAELWANHASQHRRQAPPC